MLTARVTARGAARARPPPPPRRQTCARHRWFEVEHLHARRSAARCNVIQHAETPCEERAKLGRLALMIRARTDRGYRETAACRARDTKLSFRQRSACC